MWINARDAHYRAAVHTLFGLYRNARKKALKGIRIGLYQRGHYSSVVVGNNKFRLDFLLWYLVVNCRGLILLKDVRPKGCQATRLHKAASSSHSDWRHVRAGLARQDSKPPLPAHSFCKLDLCCSLIVRGRLKVCDFGFRVRYMCTTMRSQ